MNDYIMIYDSIENQMICLVDFLIINLKSATYTSFVINIQVLFINRLHIEPNI